MQAVLHECTAVAGQATESSHFRNASWPGPSCDGYHLIGVTFDATTAYNMSKKGDLSLKEIALS